MLKKIECVIQPFKLDEVKDALSEIAVEGMTVSEVKGVGIQKGYGEGEKKGKTLFLRQKIKIEIVTSEDKVEEFIAIIQKYAKTGHIGDGKIFIYPIEDAIRIRTKESGGMAIF
jgi:nitrogen regulatory protein P-II 1